MNINSNYMNAALFSSLITAACDGTENHLTPDDMGIVYECLRDMEPERREVQYGHRRTMIIDASIGMNNHFGQFYTDHHVTIMKFHGPACMLKATILINPQLLGQPVSVGFMKCEPGMQKRFGKTAHITGDRCGLPLPNPWPLDIGIVPMTQEELDELDFPF